jgi:hypothetical protein
VLESRLELPNAKTNRRTIYVVRTCPRGGTV